jgi:hypothetical protein
MALEGSLYSSLTPTPGTGVSLGIGGSFSPTAPTIMIRNTNSIGGSDIILREIQMIVTAVGGLSSLESCVFMDTTSRYASGGLIAGDVVNGSALVNTNIRPGHPSTLSAQIRTATTSMTATTPTATAKLHSRQKLRTAALVVGDIISISFGSDVAPGFGFVSGTTAQIMKQGANPVVIPPQCDFLYYLWATGFAAQPAFEISMLFSER